MTWPVALQPGVDLRLERLILPDQALTGGILITPPDVAAAARRRRALFDTLTEELGRNPHDVRLGTASARIPGHPNPAYVSVIQDNTEALHVWWRWSGLRSSIEVLDVALTPHLPPAPELDP